MTATCVPLVSLPVNKINSANENAVSAPFISHLPLSSHLQNKIENHSSISSYFTVLDTLF